MPVLDGDGMKTPLERADINTDDDGTKLVLIHTDSRAREDARDRCLFALVTQAAPVHDKFGCMTCTMRKDSRPL